MNGLGPLDVGPLLEKPECEKHEKCKKYEKCRKSKKFEKHRKFRKVKMQKS